MKSMRDLATAPGRASANKAQGGIQMGYPSYSATVRVFEEVGLDTLTDSDSSVVAPIYSRFKAAEGDAGDALELFGPRPLLDDGEDAAAEEP